MNIIKQAGIASILASNVSIALATVDLPDFQGGIDREVQEEIIRRAVTIDETGQLIGESSKNAGVATFFSEYATDAEQDAAAVDYAAQVVANGGKPLHGTDEFVAGQDFNGGAMTAHDAMITRATQAVLNDEGLKAATPEEFKQATGFTRAEIIKANSEHYNNRVDVDKAHDANVEKVEKEVNRQSQIDDNSDKVRDNKGRSDANHSSINVNRSQIERNGNYMNENRTHIASNTRAISNNNARINQNEARINNLEETVERQGLEMREHLDGVRSTIQATVNAKIVPRYVGKFAMGAGLGGAGEKNSLAIGGGYRFNEHAHTSFTVAGESDGKHTEGQVSYGVGVGIEF